MSISKILCNADRILTNYSLLENLVAFILEPVSDMIMADICKNNYINVSCLRLSHVHVLKHREIREQICYWKGRMEDNDC